MPRKGEQLHTLVDLGPFRAYKVSMINRFVYFLAAFGIFMTLANSGCETQPSAHVMARQWARQNGYQINKLSCTRDRDDNEIKCLLDLGENMIQLECPMPGATWFIIPCELD